MKLILAKCHQTDSKWYEYNNYDIPLSISYFLPEQFRAWFLRVVMEMLK